MKTSTYLFTGILSSVLFMPLKAAIVFTDIAPDSVTTLDPKVSSASGIVSIDFNNDATEEYNFRWDDYSDWQFGWYCHMTFAGNNEAILKAGAQNPWGASYLKNLMAGEIIGDQGSNYGNSIPEPLIGDDTDTLCTGNSAKA